MQQFNSKKITSNRLYQVIFAVWLAFTMSSCGMLYPNRMLDTDKNFTPSVFLDTVYHEFTINPGDQLQVLVYPNKGYNLIESQISNQINYIQPQNIMQSLNYQVDVEGNANLPRLGFVQVSGQTESMLEKQLTQLYSAIYEDPLVNVILSGKYFTVYRGGSDAKQVALTRSDISLIEAIGMAGGVPENGRSSKIKVLRNIQGVPMIQEIDLSNINQLALGNAYIQPNDVIYIEPIINSNVFQEIGPILSTVSSIAVIYAFFVNINQ